jgi:hypothetical protein
MTVTIYRVCVVTFMMTMYALESRSRAFILAFALGCLLSSSYGFLSGAWPFGVVELVWSGIALHRYLTQNAAPGGPGMARSGRFGSATASRVGRAPNLQCGEG